MSEKDNKVRAQNWKGDMDAILIFVSGDRQLCDYPICSIGPGDDGLGRSLLRKCHSFHRRKLQDSESGPKQYVNSPSRSDIATTGINNQQWFSAKHCPTQRFSRCQVLSTSFFSCVQLSLVSQSQLQPHVRVVSNIG
jgi:hypothetical protein